jgi:flavin-dependent dehydrogenase
VPLAIRPQSVAEVLVLGGGPAGSTAASLLAAWGHGVHLITRPAAESRLAVSLPPSCAKLFDAIGITDVIDRAGFIRSTGNTVWWGGGDARVEPFAGGARGWQMEVSRLSELILDRGAAIGVRIERRVMTEPLDAPETFVLDCTGRAGLVARAKNLRRYHDGPRTIALIGEWHRDGAWPVPDDTHTLIESYDDGWMWSVPTSPGTRYVSAMIDPERSDLASGGPAEIYLAEIAKTRVFKQLTTDATFRAGAWGRDASTYGAREYAGDRWLLVGDAGSFIDPLSSAGVKKALASGWLAAITAHTWLTAPAMRSHALDFFAAREREIERHFSWESRRFLAAAAQGHSHAFWGERSDDPRDDWQDGDAIRAAFDHMKASESFEARVAPGLRIEPRPCIRGHDIVLEPQIVPRDRAPVRHVRDVDVLVVLELAPGAREVPGLYEAYLRRQGPVPLHDFLFALATAVARGWLVTE